MNQLQYPKPTPLMEGSLSSCQLVMVNLHLSLFFHLIQNHALLHQHNFPPFSSFCHPSLRSHCASLESKVDELPPPSLLLCVIDAAAADSLSFFRQGKEMRAQIACVVSRIFPAFVRSIVVALLLLLLQQTKHKQTQTRWWQCLAFLAFLHSLPSGEEGGDGEGGYRDQMHGQWFRWSVRPMCTTTTTTKTRVPVVVAVASTANGGDHHHHPHRWLADFKLKRTEDQKTVCVSVCLCFKDTARLISKQQSVSVYLSLLRLLSTRLHFSLRKKRPPSESVYDCSTKVLFEKKGKGDTDWLWKWCSAVALTYGPKLNSDCIIDHTSSYFSAVALIAKSSYQLLSLSLLLLLVILRSWRTYTSSLQVSSWSTNVITSLSLSLSLSQPSTADRSFHWASFQLCSLYRVSLRW